MFDRLVAGAVREDVQADSGSLVGEPLLVGVQDVQAQHLARLQQDRSPPEYATASYLRTRA